VLAGSTAVPLIPSLLSHLQPTGSHNLFQRVGEKLLLQAPTCSPEEKSWGGEAAATYRDGATPTCLPEERSWGGMLSRTRARAVWMAGGGDLWLSELLTALKNAEGVRKLG
jgi:hypothetical protein